MTVWVSIAITGLRLVLLGLAGAELLRAFTLPTGRLKRRHLMVGAIGMVGALVRL